MSQQVPQADLQNRADKFALSVNQKFKTTGDWTKAFTLAQNEDEAGAEAYRLVGIGAAPLAADQEPTPVLSLSTMPGESFDALAMRYAVEKNVSLREAVHEVGKARPDLAASR